MAAAMSNKAPCHQFSFSSGILDDPVKARSDLKAYYSGALDLTNLICLPLGGVTLRGGLKSYMEVPEAVDGCRLFKFELTPDNSYLCCFLHKKINILQNSEIKKNLETDYEGFHLRDLDFNQSLDTAIIASAHYRLKKLVYGGSSENWSLNNVELENPPQATFADTPGGTNEIQHLKFTNVGAGNSFRLKLEGYKTQSVVWSSDNNANANSIKTALNNLEIIDKDKGGVTVSFVNGEFKVEFGGTDGKKTWEDIIISIEEAADNCRVYTKCIQEGKPPMEPLWSDLRGWPFSCCDYQGRNIYGGCTAKENILCGSMTINPYCFRNSDEMLDDEAITLPVNAEGCTRINRVFGLQKLFVFTNKGIFVIPESPLTPANAYAKSQTDVPCAKIRPAAIDGDVVYVTQSPDGRNQSVGTITYSNETEKYFTDDLAQFSYSVMREPVSIDVRRGTRRNNATYLFVVNADGTLAVLNTKRSQELNGWTICNTTDGKFRDVCVVNDTAYFLVERQIKGQTRYFIETWDDEAKFDLSVELEQEKPTRVWSNPELDFYEGLEVGIYADGLAYGTETVLNGTVTLDYEASHLEVGLPFAWSLETMPMVAELTDGTLVGHRHRLPQITLRVENSAGIKIGKQTLCSRFFRKGYDFSEKDVLLNGTIKVRQLGYYGGNRDELATVKCSGSSLQPLTILSITTEVIQ